VPRSDGGYSLQRGRLTREQELTIEESGTGIAEDNTKTIIIWQKHS
jgi:hypothetical protein